MNNIYCIAYSDYDEYDILFMFEDKNKRDKLLDKFGDNYFALDKQLNDDMDIDSVKTYYSIVYSYGNLYFDKQCELTNPHILKELVVISNFIVIPITKEEYELADRKKARKLIAKYKRKYNKLIKCKSEMEVNEIIRKEEEYANLFYI